ncbi:opine metallophore biosynthesis dehydrogenase [Rossellomorea aquimaris]|uniref:DUF2338 family protein n=1 Tax=Rossellomorea aquimaris TaxID=189382 RepID=A0A1J6WKV1_9BACI|nr:opine metallophore biosynthesis dehydrogenase [Rossellomorea aquimaris]OIU68607.1 hypothetical protein BHE18_16925 [Rossellomorea aquimaris]
MNPRVLLAGTGPVSVQLAVIAKKKLNCEVGIAGRRSVRGRKFFQALAENRQRIAVSVQKETIRGMEGVCVIDNIYSGYEAVQGKWDVLVLTVTTDSYTAVLKSIDREVLKKVSSIVLISPTFGSNSLVKQFIKGINAKCEIISFSTYLGDTRWVGGEPSHHVITAAVKKRLYIGSGFRESKVIQRLVNAGEDMGIELVHVPSPLEAETRNISLYVHPPLFMNEYTLRAIFEEGTRKYVYKLFPEGPITHRLIRIMRSQWKEMMGILEKLGVPQLNLLKFMTDDTYPVRPESLPRRDIEHFGDLEPVHQEYLLYIRYTSLLIDPFSTPDEDGRYFDFSAVPIRKLFVNHEGELDIPRMPKEDYYRIKIIQGIARHLEVECPAIDGLILVYEENLKKAAELYKDKLLSEAFILRDFHGDIGRITRELKTHSEE